MMNRKFKKITFVYFLFGFVAVCFLLFPFALILNKNTAYFSYKELTYDVIIDNVVGKENDPEKKVILISDFIFNSLSTPYKANVVDKDIYNDLIRGVAWCDQRAWALVTFMGKLGMEGRVIFTKNHDRVSTHSVAEILINRKYCLFDPQFGFFGYNRNEEIASYEEICHDPQIFNLSPKMLKLKHIDKARYLILKDTFDSNVYYLPYVEPVTWRNPVLNRDLLRKSIARIIHMYAYLFGKYFVNFYQDAYAKLYLSADSDEALYESARNYDLYFRYRLAIAGYEKVIKKFPNTKKAENALYFLAILYNKTNEIDSSIKGLSSLISKYPETKWRGSAYYYLGYNYELLKDYSSAVIYYKKALDEYKKSNSDLLSSDELKVIERLYCVVDKASAYKMQPLINR